jgi:hypothetical protein
MGKWCYRILIFAIPLWQTTSLFPQTFIPQSVTDQTPSSPLSNPTPGSHKIRYISGFGSDNSFKLFFEDRNVISGGLYRITYLPTTAGPTGFPATGTGTNVYATHFFIKDWPINVSGTDYAFRGWGSDNSPIHKFYVSNDLVTWTFVDTFSFRDASTFTNRRGWVYYGFRDILKINGTYYGFAEANSGETMIVRSAAADDRWEAFTKVGGSSRSDGPLQIPAGRSNGWTCNGGFMDLGYNRGYGSLFTDPNKQFFYLAINTAAKTSLSPAQFEASFIDSANWKWNDGTIGPAANPIFSYNASHAAIAENWLVPRTDMNGDWTVMYAATYGSNTSVGYFTLTPPEPIVKTKIKIWLEGAYQTGGSMRTDLKNGGYIPTVSPYADARNAGSVPDGVVDWVFVQLRETATGPAVAERSFFLKSDGSLTETDGATTDLTLTGTGEGSYFIVVRQRNHLAVMSSLAQPLGTCTPSQYDFSTGTGRYYGAEARLLESGVYGMVAGDANGSGTVDASDRSQAWNNRNRTGYDGADSNLSGTVDASDRSLKWNNRNKASQVP